ncbi:MAG: CoA pyrophosphatase [Ardenticatenales bacterium]
MSEAPAPFLTSQRALVDRLAARLARPDRPGENAFRPLSVAGRVGRTVDEARMGGAREGAVLVLMYPKDDAPHIVLTERRADLRDHAGQVSFPGGRIEPEETAAEAALREASEEVGLTDAVAILGNLSPLWIPPTNYLVFPIVAAAAARPAFVTAADEVAALVEAPLAALYDPAARCTIVRRGLDGKPRPVPALRVAGHEIWGATAMILGELTALLRDAG